MSAYESLKKLAGIVPATPFWWQRPLEEVLVETQFSWQKRSDARYEAQTPVGRAVLAKDGHRWYLEVGDKRFEMPRRADFSHAEGMIAQLMRRTEGAEIKSFDAFQSDRVVHLYDTKEEARNMARRARRRLREAGLPFAFGRGDEGVTVRTRKVDGGYTVEIALHGTDLQEKVRSAFDDAWGLFAGPMGPATRDCLWVVHYR